MFHKRPLDTIRHQLPIRHVSFKSRKQYRTDTGKIGSKALALGFPVWPLGPGPPRPPDALDPGFPGAAARRVAQLLRARSLPPRAAGTLEEALPPTGLQAQAHCGLW